MQSDINNIVNWANKWLMRLNIAKCKVMHVDKANKQHNYTLNSYENSTPIFLEKTALERDLGILIENNLKFSAQTNQAATNGNKELGMLKRTFRSRGEEMWKYFARHTSTRICNTSMESVLRRRHL